MREPQLPRLAQVLRQVFLPHLVGRIEMRIGIDDEHRLTLLRNCEREVGGRHAFAFFRARTGNRDRARAVGPPPPVVTRKMVAE